MQRTATKRAPGQDGAPLRRGTTVKGAHGTVSPVPPLPPMPVPAPGADENLPLRRKTTKRVPHGPILAAPAPDGAPLRRMTTRRVPNANPNAYESASVSGATRAKVSYQTVQQGFKELYSPTNENESAVPDVDIVFVPGLGAHPEDSWKSDTNFNWAAGGKNDGLARNFPNARMLLYQYESAWQGSLKVKQFLHDIALSLLVGLRGEREGVRERPIVFIGHSMGGLVVAKAIALADSRRDLAPRMFECIAGCAFFGTPFGGAPIAVVASMLGKVGEFFNWAQDSRLVEMMKPGSEILNDLRNELLRLASKLSPKFEMVCFWETHSTKLQVEKFGDFISQMLKSAVQYEMVSEESATLPGVDARGLAANHRDLVRFTDIKDARYQLVLNSLKPLINGAALVVKNRLNSTRGIDQTVVNNVMELLNGAQVSKKRKDLSQNFPPSSWISSEAEYIQWLDPVMNHDNSAAPNQRGDALFICGPEGKGKTRATMAALQDIDAMILADEAANNGKGPILLAYFFCDPSADFTTAEDLLKSIMRQLISQQPSLAVWAKHFVKKKGSGDSTKSHANLTVENLWQALQDTLTDEFIGRRVYIVINNLHTLPEDAESTVKLMRFLGKEMQDVRKADDKRVPVRWLVASRDGQVVEENLKLQGTRLMDLEDSKYCDQVQVELRKTAHGKVAELGTSKSYNKALEWFASTLIGNRASTTQWISLACIQLGELPDTESDQRIRRMLKEMPQDLNALLDAAWLKIFRANEEEVDDLKEMLRTLILTVEDPTEEELGVLTGLSSSNEGKEQLHNLIERCRPLLVSKETGEGECTISFINVAVKDHLLQKQTSKKMLEMSAEEKRWQHGVIALRCLTHIKEAFESYDETEQGECVDEDADDEDGDGAEEVAEDEADEENIDQLVEDEGGNGQEAAEADAEEEEREEGEEEEGEEAAQDDEDEEEDNEEEVNEEEDNGEDEEQEEEEEGEEEGEEGYDLPDEIEYVEVNTALPYTVKNWLYHASKETVEISEILSKDDFWEKGSVIRYQWLTEYMRLKTDLQGFDGKSLSALHIAASVGFKPLVVALIRNGYADEINLRDTMVNTPLHLAAYLGRADIVEVLLEHGAEIDDGIDVGAQTPLHMAALTGHLSVMRKLITRNANTNAVASDIGPVMNAAICSGNPQAVELLVGKGVSLTVEDDSIPSPLALAGLFSDLSMFEYLIGAYANEIPPKEFDKAFVKAAEAGRAEVFNKLLSYEHPQTCYQAALEAATGEENWDIIMTMLEKCQGLDCNNLFVSAAMNVDGQHKVLEAVWKHANGQLPQEVINRALYEATDLEKESTVELLMKTFGADPNAEGESFGTALTAAANDGTLQIVRLLVNKGADVNSPNGWALQTAAAKGHYDVVVELLDRGANVNAMNSNENFPQGTALQAAVESSQVEIVKLLLEHKANPNLGAGAETCPLIAAARKGEGDILKLLVDAEADVDVFGGQDNSTVLINAAARLPWKSLKVLLDAGADVNLADQDGDTALIAAASMGDHECVVNLLDMGADMFHSSGRGQNALQTALHFKRDDCLQTLIDRVSEFMTASRKDSKGVESHKPGLKRIDEEQERPEHDKTEDSIQKDAANKAKALRQVPEPAQSNSGHLGNGHGSSSSASVQQEATRLSVELDSAFTAHTSFTDADIQEDSDEQSDLEQSDITSCYLSGLPPDTVQQTWSQSPRQSFSESIRSEPQQNLSQPSLFEQASGQVQQPTPEASPVPDALPDPALRPIRRRPAPSRAFKAQSFSMPVPGASSHASSLDASSTDSSRKQATRADTSPGPMSSALGNESQVPNRGKDQAFPQKYHLPQRSYSGNDESPSDYHPYRPDLHRRSSQLGQSSTPSPQAPSVAQPYKPSATLETSPERLKGRKSVDDFLQGVPPPPRTNEEEPAPVPKPQRLSLFNMSCTLDKAMQFGSGVVNMK